MNATGWIFLAVCWGLVLTCLAWCMIRVFSSRKHWTNPEEDIRELHHGEFGEKTDRTDSGPATKGSNE